MTARSSRAVAVENMFTAPQADYTRMLLAATLAHLRARPYWERLIAAPIISLVGVTKDFEQRRPVRATGATCARSTMSPFGRARRDTRHRRRVRLGKSTLLRMVLRLIRPTAGTIEIEGRDIWSLPARDLKAFRRRIQPIFQNPASSFNPRQSIGSILSAPLEVHGIGDAPEPRGIRSPALLERVGLPADMRGPLSAPALGRPEAAHRHRPRRDPRAGIVVADEPTSALDVSVQAQVLEIFQETKRAMGLTCVFVSHNLAVIRQVSDRVAVMRQGAVVEYGPVESALCGAPTRVYAGAARRRARPSTLLSQPPRTASCT